MPNEKVNLIQRLDNPAAFLEVAAKLLMQSPMLGLSAPGDAFVLAWHCLSEGISPLDFSRRYHIIGGKLAMRADYMHAAFREAGGRVEWINSGDDGQCASGQFYSPNDDADMGMTVEFTIEDARKLLGKHKSGCDAIDASGSGWTKDRGAMLRARCLSKGIRMVCPEAIAGVYTPDELETPADGDAPAATPAPTPRASRKPAAAAAPATAPETTVTPMPPELLTQAATQDPDPAPAQAPAPAPASAVEAAPAEDENAPASPNLLSELVAWGTKLPDPTNTRTLTIKEVGEKLCAAAKVSRPQDATVKQVRTLIERIRGALAQT